jgi:hypothetical protein
MRWMRSFLKLEDVCVLLRLSKGDSIVPWNGTRVVALREGTNGFRVWKFGLLEGER